MEVAASNIVNKDTLADAQGRYNPYRPRSVELAPGSAGGGGGDDGVVGGAGMGVHVARINIHADRLRAAHMPESPFADSDGYVMVPDIDQTREQVTVLEASRAYEANAAAAEATKSMLAQMLRLIA